MKYYRLNVIDNYLKIHNLSKTQFCKLCGISMKTLKKIYADCGHIKLKTFLKILNVIQVSPSQLLTF